MKNGQNITALKIEEEYGEESKCTYFKAKLYFAQGPNIPYLISLEFQMKITIIPHLEI